ncbi:hypothetical protein ACTFIY_010764 [Dictyostelium cf. discoideum]
MVLIVKFLNSFYNSIYDIDFTNATSLTVTLSNYIQNLPPFSNFNSKKLNTLNLNGNTFNGAIPNEYCYFGKNVLNFGNNNLNGNVPDCFLCYGGGQFPNLFPIPGFVNFNPSQPQINCNNYQMDLTPLNLPFYTNRTTVETITGQNFGWEVLISSILPDVIAEIVVPNKEFTISIPPGAGKQNGVILYSFQNLLIRTYVFFLQQLILIISMVQISISKVHFLVLIQALKINLLLMAIHIQQIHYRFQYKQDIKYSNFGRCSWNYTTEFEFISAPTLPPTLPPTQTPSETPPGTPTQTQTLSPTPTPKQSESNELSCSPNLSNSFILLISLIFAFFLVI